MKPVQILIIGAGNRGNTYASYSKSFPNEMEIVSVAEPNDLTRNLFADEYKLDSSIHGKKH